MKVRLLWPAAAGMLIALGAAAAAPVTRVGRLWIAFFALGTVLPLILAIALAIDPQKLSPSVVRLLRALALLISGAALVIGVGHAASHRFEVAVALVQVVALVALTTVILRPANRPATTHLIGTAVVWAAVSISAWGVAVTLLWWYFPGGLLRPWPLAVLTVSALTVWGALWLPNFIAGRLLGWLGTAAALVVLAVASVRTNGLFDVHTAYHWEFYIGPAELVRQGGWLLWDVPAQYGFLSELAIAWIPAPSPWESLFVLNSLMCFLLAASVFFLLRALGKGLINLAMSAAVALVATFFRPGLAAQITGPESFPSTGGFRFLWCVALLLVLILSLATHSRRARIALAIAGNVVFALGVLWSAESAIYSMFVWLPGYFLMVVADRWAEPNIRRRLFAIAWLAIVPVLFLLLAVAIVFAVYQIGLGHRPDLLGYYEFGLVYQGGFGAYPTTAGGPGWVLFLAFAAPLVALVWNARKQSAAASIVLVATAALVYATSSYFVGRSHPNAVWNLAPEVCIAFAVTLRLANSKMRAGPLPDLLKMVVAPILIILLVGSLGSRAALQEWVTSPQQDIAHMETALPAIDPSLADLLRAHVQPGDDVAYLGDGTDPLMFSSGPMPDGYPLWLPLDPWAAVNLLPPARRALYLERFIAQDPEGGWLIERTGSQPREQWVRQVIEAHFIAEQTYSSSTYRLTFWQPNGASH